MTWGDFRWFSRAVAKVIRSWSIWITTHDCSPPETPATSAVQAAQLHGFVIILIVFCVLVRLSVPTACGEVEEPQSIAVPSDGVHLQLTVLQLSGGRVAIDGTLLRKKHII